MTAASTQSDTAVTIALAEYTALRNEIANRLQTQATLLGVTITAVGVVGGVVLTEKGSRELLLVIPVLAPSLGLFFIEQMRQLGLLGLYIRSALWPLLQDQVPDIPVPSWERVWAAYNSPNHHRRKTSYVSFVLLASLPPGAIFFLSSVVTLGFTTSLAFDSAANAVLWLLGCGLTLLFTGLAVVLSATFRAVDLDDVLASPPT